MLDRLTRRFPKLPIIIGGQAFRHGGRELTHSYAGVQWIASLDDLEELLHPKAPRSTGTGPETA